MGKGNRNSLKRSQESVELAEKNLSRQKAKAKKSKFDKFIAITVIALAAIIVLTLAVSVMSEAGIFLRTQTAVSGEKTQVDGAMMSFFLNDYIMNWYSQYSGYMSMFSLDLTRDLKLQKFGDKNNGYGYETSFLGNFDGTWYDYFLKEVKSEVEMYIVYADAAKAHNLELTDEDKTAINETIANIDANLKSLGISYGDYYGKGVSKRDVRRCYELVYLAENFAEYKQEQLEKDVTDDQIVEYRENNKQDFYTADCLTYTISKTSKGMTDEEYDAAVKAAKAAADAIAAAKTPAEFVELVEKYESESKAANTKTEATESASATESKDESDTETEDMEKKYDKYKDTIEYETGTGNELNDFLFGNDETGSDAVEPAEKGDVTVIEETGTQTEKETTTAKKESDKKEADSQTKADTDSESESETETDKKDNGVKTYDTYKVTVYYVFEPMHLDKELTHNFAYLVSNDKHAIEEFIELFNAGEIKDMDTFKKIAEQYYEDMHSSEEHEHSSDEMFAYDSLEKQAAGAFNTSYKVLNDWVESADRKDKELSDILEIKITSTGSDNKVTTKTQYGVIFFQDHDDETWYVSAKAGTISKQFSDWYEEQLKNNPIQYGNVVNQIQTAKPYLALLGY